MTTRIDYDVNVYCPELMDGDTVHRDPLYWKMAFRDYATGEDLESLTLTLPRPFVSEIGLETLALWGDYHKHPELETWMDNGLDCWTGLDFFIDLYRNQIPKELWVELSKLPKTREEMRTQWER